MQKILDIKFSDFLFSDPKFSDVFYLDFGRMSDVWFKCCKKKYRHVKSFETFIVTYIL